MKFTKICPGCNQEKNRDCFYPDKTRKDGLRSSCIECSIKRSSAWGKKNKQRRRKASILYDYGISWDEAFEIYKRQDGCCGICSGELEFWDKKTHIDHCHKTNTVRGILCHHCNVGIGNLKDDPDLLREAAKYLEESNEDRGLS